MEGGCSGYEYKMEIDFPAALRRGGTQLSRSSTFDVKTVSGNWFISDVKTSWLSL